MTNSVRLEGKVGIKSGKRGRQEIGNTIGYSYPVCHTKEYGFYPIVNGMGGDGNRSMAVISVV